MPEPVRAEQRYLPGLDGLRAVAVLAVLAYHLGLSWAPGGLLGVGVFFTLSGYLITDLLLGQRARTGELALLDFWLRRGRRLLPALFLLLVVVVGWVALADPAQVAALRGAVAAAVGYVSNWWLIAQHSSYFAQFGPASPLGHLWSLAVEEQFYLVWPWLLYLGLRFTRSRRGRGQAHYGLAAATLALAAASAAGMALLYHPGYDPTRVYDGTDTRAFALLIGAALALVWPSRRLFAARGALSAWFLDGVGLAGLLVVGVMIWRTTEYSVFLYQGGLVLLSVATAAVIMAVAVPASRLAAALGWAPLRWVGVRSYGIYLWHYPIIVLTAPASGQETATRAVLQVGATIGVAALSWQLVEEPIRHGALGRWWARLRPPAPAVAGAGPAVASAGWGAGWGAGGGVVLAAGMPPGDGPPARHRHAASPSRSRSRRAGSPGRPRPAGWLPLGVCAGLLGLAGACLAGVIPPASSWLSHPAPPSAATGNGKVQPIPATGAGRPSPRSALSTPGPRHLRTSCRSVVHIGDSTSDGLVSADYLPNRKQRLLAQYRKRGVKTVHWEISGGRSIVETLEGQPNAHTVAGLLVQGGYDGCWVLALGTNDTADVYVGSPVSVSARIGQMMSVLGSQPVMWVNVISLLSSGPYSETDMQKWNHALVRACARYPNMRVYDWAAVARPQWFISDGIHYTSAGYAARSRDIARALAEAFPAAGTPAPAPSNGTPSPAPGCVVY